MIDWGRVKELRNEVGAEAFDEVVEMFLDEVSEALDELPEKRTSAEMKDAMHFLKGSALSLGFSEFAAICSGAEADQSLRDSLDLTALASNFDKSKSQFLTELPSHVS